MKFLPSMRTSGSARAEAARPRSKQEGDAGDACEQRICNSAVRSLWVTTMSDANVSRHAPRLPSPADRRGRDRAAGPAPAPSRLPRHHGDGRGLWHRGRHDLPVGRQGVRPGLHRGARTDRPAGGRGRAGLAPWCCASRSAPAPPPLAGALAGLGASATGGLALLQPAGQDAPRRALGLALTLLAVAALVAPSPLAVAAASVMKIQHAHAC